MLTLMQRPFLFLFSFFAQVCMRWPFVRSFVCLMHHHWVSVLWADSLNLYLSIIQIIIIRLTPISVECETASMQKFPFVCWKIGYSSGKIVHRLFLRHTQVNTIAVPVSIGYRELIFYVAFAFTVNKHTHTRKSVPSSIHNVFIRVRGGDFCFSSNPKSQCNGTVSIAILIIIRQFSSVVERINRRTTDVLKGIIQFQSLFVYHSQREAAFKLKLTEMSTMADHRSEGPTL